MPRFVFYAQIPAVLALNVCKGADLMNSLADSLMLGAPTPERRRQAELWVDRALGVIEKTRNEDKSDPEALSHCEIVLAAALFNKGSMREVCRSRSSLS